jgi:hypothetical protein
MLLMDPLAFILANHATRTLSLGAQPSNHPPRRFLRRSANRAERIR